MAGLQPVRGVEGAAAAFVARRNLGSSISYTHPDRDQGGDGVGEDLGGGLGGDVFGGVGAGRLPGGGPDLLAAFVALGAAGDHELH